MKRLLLILAVVFTFSLTSCEYFAPGTSKAITEKEQLEEEKKQTELETQQLEVLKEQNELLKERNELLREQNEILMK